MSIVRLVNVMEESEATGVQRLVLFALAEHAHDDGSRAFPSVQTLMRRARASRRAVQTALRGLEDTGRIKATREATPTTATVYSVHAAPVRADLAARLAFELSERRAGRGNSAVIRELEEELAQGGAESAPRAESAPGGAQNAAQGGAESAPYPSTNRQTDNGSTSDAPRQTSSRDTKESADPEVLDLCVDLARLVWERDSRFDITRAYTSAWLKPMRLLVHNDRAGDVAEVRRILEWSQSNAFWQGNVLSPDALRRNFTRLLVQSEHAAGPRRGATPGAGGLYDRAAGLVDTGENP